MKFLLDENFPLALYRRLRDAGKDVEQSFDEQPCSIPADFRSQLIIRL